MNITLFLRCIIFRKDNEKKILVRKKSKNSHSTILKFFYSIECDLQGRSLVIKHTIF